MASLKASAVVVQGEASESEDDDELEIEVVNPAVTQVVLPFSLITRRTTDFLKEVRTLRVI